MDFEEILSVVFIIAIVVAIGCFIFFALNGDFWIILSLISVLVLWRPTVRLVAKFLFESHYKEGKIRNALLRFYIRHLDRSVDDRFEEDKGRPKPIGHLKLFVSEDAFDVFEREEDKHHFLFSEKRGGVYEDVFIFDEYPNFSINDLDAAKARHKGYQGKVVGEDRYVYFDFCYNLCVLG